MYRHRYIYLHCMYIYMYMLRTDCKLDQFVNGPPVYKPVIQFLNGLACFQLYIAKWSRLETRPNGLKAGRMSWKLYKLAKQTARGLNGMKLAKRFTEAYKQGSLTGETQPTPACIN